ncbi:MAG: periplasmic binding protein/LacI transcriptional regulator [Herbinix sp.]|jgi:ribose transport system substrate-binding protein|nr:periplasmic binding protein/LacI transcriptional regulator [Herbinix sp.]
MDCIDKKYINITSASNSVAGRLLVYLITMDKTDRFWYYIDHGASVMAALVGLNYIWDAPVNKDTQLQIEILNRAVEEGADLVMLAANDPIVLSSAIEDAKSRGVYIIYVDSPANEEAVITLATDNYKAGTIAGNLMINEMEGKGISSGSIAIIGVNRVTNSTMNREAGFRDIITSDGRFVILPTVDTEGNIELSQRAAERFISENEDLVGIFATNEGTTEGVGFAIRSLGSDVIGIGFDYSDIIEELVYDRSLKAVMLQNPFTMGYLGMAEAYAALHGYNTGPNYIDTGVSVLTR